MMSACSSSAVIARPTAINSANHIKAFGVIYFTLRDVGWDSVFIEAGTQARFDPTSNLCH